MNRRNMIIGSAAILVGGGSVYAYRRLVPATHNIGKVPGMKGMDATPSVEDPGMQGDVALRIKALPEGEPLGPLSRLANTSTINGRFEAAISAQPATVEFVPGKKTEILGYNSLTPGPVIEVTEGDSVKISFTNRIPARESTIHWHGLPVPASQDGNPMNPVASGETRIYEFTLPADSAGSFWYHPHPRENTAQQVYEGLAAPFIVKPKNDPLPAELADTTLFITTLSLLESGVIAPNTMMDWMNGREGDHILINGRKMPVLSVAPGSSRRFRLYNATNGRYMRLAFEDHGMTLIGTDGGLLQRPVPGVAHILLAPAERVEVVVDFRESTGRIVLQDLAYERGWMGPGRPTATTRALMTIEIAGVPQKPIPLPGTLRSIEALGTPVATKRLVFGEKMSMTAGGMAMSFLINDQTFDTKRVNLTSRVSEVELWEIVNPTDMDHPLHIHGTQFQVLDRESLGLKTPEPILSWKDTVNVVRGETVRLKVRHEMPGLRMYHCHILEHEQLGMMGVLKVT